MEVFCDADCSEVKTKPGWCSSGLSTAAIILIVVVVFGVVA
jgi:hypothetical protein